LENAGITVREADFGHSVAVAIIVGHVMSLFIAGLAFEPAMLNAPRRLRSS